jgi:hypothetical protein
LFLEVFLYIFLEGFEFVVCCFHDFSDLFCVKLFLVKKDLQVEFIFSLANFGFEYFFQGRLICVTACRCDMELLYNVFFLHESLNLGTKVLVSLVALALKGFNG